MKRRGLILLILVMSLVFVRGGIAGEESHKHSQEQPAWLDKLVQQLVTEEAIEGNPGQTARIGLMHEKIMERTPADAMMEQMMKSQPGTTGGFTVAGALHMASQGALLGPVETGETVTPGMGRCSDSAPVRSFDISAINVEITLNQYQIHTPGYMFVLTKNIEKVRAEERRNKEARKDPNDPGAVSNGLQGDWISPLAIRANQGECLRITLTNRVEDEAISFHLHGSSLIVRSSGRPATATNPEVILKPGESREFEWQIPGDQQEGSHIFHSHQRSQNVLGLFGALVVLPRGSRHLSPFTGEEMESGWAAMIEDPNGPDFRDFVVIYHEVGDETFLAFNRNGELLPQRDPATDAYRPASRALNYRSEPFMSNLLKQKEIFGFEDESSAYNAYVFGDPATPIPRGYLGDPAKWRLIHGGSEIFHSHHPHSGTIRWRRQPKADEDDLDAASNGPIKFPRQIRSISDRIDVQSIGPSTNFDLTQECGMGGCQHFAGEFLFHCHVAHHYVAGMWSYARVYNTLQIDPAVKTDTMPPLQELPDRKGRQKPGVDSTALIGTTVNWFGKRFKITLDETDWSGLEDTNVVTPVAIKEWVNMLLPPQGKPGGSDDQWVQAYAYDASVWNWTWAMKKGKPLALSEPELIFQFPKYKPEQMGRKAGERYPILFDPVTGKLAWPHWTPHLKRVPHARNHGPAPTLEPIRLRETSGKVRTMSTEPARPGEQGPWSDCPKGTHDRKYYQINAITLPLVLSKAQGKQPPVVDPQGQIFVLHEEEEAIRANDDLKYPLVYRGNVYDCIDVLFKSELRDNAEVFNSSKVNIHIHQVQFDTQASDGVMSGFSYEQSIRPFTILKKTDKEDPDHGLPVPQSTLLAQDVKAGATSITVASTVRKEIGGEAEKKLKERKIDSLPMFHVESEINIGMDEPQTTEVARIKEIKGNTIILDAPLKFAHKKNEIVSTEFVWYRYWIDVDFGNFYWHDHAFGATSWQHGLFGSTAIEPIGSTYHDPRTGKPIRSGPIADIHTNEPVSPQIKGSFRELFVQLQDTNINNIQRITKGMPEGVKVEGTPAFALPGPNPLLPAAMPDLNGGMTTSGSAFNMRAEPLSRRLANNPDASMLFSSKVHGDPDTPMLRAYLGDPIVIKMIQTATNEVHIFGVSGHWFRAERQAIDAIPRASIPIAIAEHWILAINAAGGPQRKPGDYLYYNGRPSHFAEGSWGIIRVLDKRVPDLMPLPGREVIPEPAKGSVCPPEAPVKSFNVVAIEKGLKFNKKAPEVIEVDFGRLQEVENKRGKIFVLEGEKKAVLAGEKDPHPLTLRVNKGDCIKITLKNEIMSGEKVSIHLPGLAFDPADSLGINLGNNPGDQTVAKGGSKTYTFYAHPEFGEISTLIRSFGNVLTQPRDGLFGAVVVGPRGSTYRDPVTGEDISLKNSWRADVIVDRGLPENVNRTNYRHAALFFQEEDNILGTSFMPYLKSTAGLVGVNYRSEPLSYRIDEVGCEVAEAFSCKAAGEPGTPIIEAHAGDPVRIDVFGAHTEQNHIFHLENHLWPFEPLMKGTDMLDSQEFGTVHTIPVNITAGGPYRITGDYLYQDHRQAYAEAGLWGIFRVLQEDDTRILPLMPRAPVGRPVSVLGR